uniref:Uncharacterized protein n=1 Tax=Aegilops tauschii subsp. strangulata TaxID=200361 RepID=A0A453K523_AEGTS
MDLQAEVSIMKMSRRVADTESSSNGEAALLEELEDEKILCAPCHIWLGHLQILGSRVPDLKRRNTRPHPLSGRRGLQRFSSV